MKIQKYFEIGLINTLRLNFHYYRFHKAIKLPIIASRHLRIRHLGGKLTHLRPKTASIRLGFDNVGIFDNKKSRSIWEIGDKAEIIVKDNVSFGNGFKLCVMGGGELLIGSNLNITANSTIICNKKIQLGDNVLLSWDILIMDTDFHKIFRDKSLVNHDKKVIIEDNVWIGCRSTILKGSVIPQGSVIAAGTTISTALTNSNFIWWQSHKDLENRYQVGEITISKFPYLSIRVAWLSQEISCNFAVVNQNTESYDIKKIALSERTVKLAWTMPNVWRYL